MHNCPECGKPTEGSWSEGGIKWAVCEDCLEKLKQDTDRFEQAEKFVRDSGLAGRGE